MVRLLSMGIECVSSMVFLIPVIIILQYILFKQHSFYQFIMVLITAAYFMAVYSVTGLPTAYTLRFDFSLNLIPLMPLGFLLPVLWSKYRDAKKMVFIGLAVSVVIEVLQIFTFRFTDIDDLITNTLGTALGYGIAKMISFKLPLKISEKEKTVSMKYEPAIIGGTVFLIGFFLKPPVSNAMWDIVLSSSWWESIK